MNGSQRKRTGRSVRGTESDLWQDLKGPRRGSANCSTRSRWHSCEPTCEPCPRPFHLGSRSTRSGGVLLGGEPADDGATDLERASLPNRHICFTAAPPALAKSPACSIVRKHSRPWPWSPGGPSRPFSPCSCRSPCGPTPALARWGEGSGRGTGFRAASSSRPSPFRRGTSPGSPQRADSSQGNDSGSWFSRGSMPAKTAAP